MRVIYNLYGLQIVSRALVFVRV